MYQFSLLEMLNESFSLEIVDDKSHVWLLYDACKLNPSSAIKV